MDIKTLSAKNFNAYAIKTKNGHKIIVEINDENTIAIYDADMQQDFVLIELDGWHDEPSECPIVYVYSDPDSEDFTDKFKIPYYEVEDE